MDDRIYKVGVDRRQAMLLPPSVEEFVDADNPVRAIDAYVDSLMLERLGFRYAGGGRSAGQPAYHPGTLLKLYLYGYLQRVRSSRRLAAEACRNLEMIWLLSGLRPSYKTIADFRKENRLALQAVNRDFVQMCHELELYGGQRVSVDGSFFSGNASGNSIYRKDRLEREIQCLESDIAAYHEALDQADQEGYEPPREEASLVRKLARLATRQSQLAALEESGERQCSTTDPDARALAKRGHKSVGYNVQTVVDDRHRLLVACEVTHDGNDSQQLAPMTRIAQAVLGVEALDVLADAGYFDQAQIKQCEDAGAVPYVPIPDKNRPIREAGRFERGDFRYAPEEDRYYCPAGRPLRPNGHQRKNGKLRIRYASSIRECGACHLRGQCLSERMTYRQIQRWEHEEVIERHRQRMAKYGQRAMRERATLAEHPFGTLKLWCGWTHFLVRGFEKVRGEMALLMLGYNFKRALNLLGQEAFYRYCRQRANARA